MNIQRRIYVNHNTDVIIARLQAREMAREMGFRPADQARISLATSELARALAWTNAAPGELVISDINQNRRQGLKVVCLVKLEYIPRGDKSNLAIEASVLRCSLAGARQLVDEIIIEEQGDQQAQITLIKWLN